MTFGPPEHIPERRNFQDLSPAGDRGGFPPGTNIWKTERRLNVPRLKLILNRCPVATRFLGIVITMYYRDHATALQNIEVFRTLRLDPELRTLVWPNGADFAPNFYERNCLSARIPRLAPAAEVRARDGLLCIADSTRPDSHF